MTEIHKSALEYIYDTAIHKAKEAVEDHCLHTCGEWMDVARDAEHILRKEEEWAMMKSGNADMMATHSR